MSKDPPFPFDNYEEFSFDNFSDEECIKEFRDEKNDLPILANALGIPPVFRCLQRSVFDGMEGLRMLLKSYFLCHSLYFCVDYDMCSSYLWNDNLNDKITDKSTTETLVYDGVILIRFWEKLERGRAGLKKIIICFIFVFKEGRRHDSGMLADSGMYDELARNSFDLAGHPLCLYGDPVFPLTVHLQAPFRYVVLTQQMEEFNECRSFLGRVAF